jgi:Swiss Army Knife protein, DSP-PTPase phosphatase domain
MGLGGLFLRKVRAEVADRPTGFVWVIPTRLAGSGFPASRGQVEWLAHQGVGGILTLTESPLPSEWLQGLGLVYSNVPMKDHEPPPVAKLEAAVGFIEEQLKSGRAVAVHCLAGKGRTMTTIAAYLMKKEGLDPDEAVQKVREIRPGAVEDGQEKSLKSFSRKLRKSGAKDAGS